MNVFIAEAMSAANRGEAAIFWGLREAIGSNHSYALCTSTPDADAREYGPGVRLIRDNVVTARTVLGRIAQATLLFVRLVAIAVRLRFRPPNSKSSLSPLADAFQTADVILIGHDNVLVGRMLFNLCGVVILARAIRKPVVVYAGTVGPFSDRISRVMTAWLLRHCDLITLREPTSVATTRQLLGSVSVPVHLATDPAFLMPPASRQRVEEILDAEKISGNLSLISVTTTLDMAHRFARAHKLSPEKGIEVYLRERAAMLDGFIENNNAYILLLSHCLDKRPNRDDRLANAALMGYIRHPENVRVLPDKYSAREIKGLIGSCRLLIGDRTHSMIAAASLGVPVVGISSRITETKTRGILGHTMGFNDTILDVESLDACILAKKARQSWERHNEIRVRLNGLRPEITDLARLPGKLLHEMLAHRVPAYEAEKSSCTSSP